MKLSLLVLVLLIGVSMHAQEKKFQLKKYHFVMLTKGENRTQDSLTAVKLQEGHMANIRKMADDGFLIVAGPFGDSEGGGIFIMRTETIEETEAMMKNDPAVAAGRLGYKIRPWYSDPSVFTAETEKKGSDTEKKEP